MESNPFSRIFSWHGAVVSLGCLWLSGCTTTSNRTVYKDEGIVVRHSELTDYGIKWSGHGSYILVVNSAEVFGKKYPVIAGEGTCVLTVPAHKLLLFVCAAAEPGSGLRPNRELHVVNLQDRIDTIIPVGQSKIGEYFGAHLPGSKYAAKVGFENDGLLRISTYNGRTAFKPNYEPTQKSVFIVSLPRKKLLSGPDL